MAAKRQTDPEDAKKSAHLREIKVSKKFVRVPFTSIEDLAQKASTLSAHVATVSTAVDAGKTFLGRAGANAIVASCAGSTDFNMTVRMCGLTGAGMQRCVVKKLKEQGYDPGPLDLNIQTDDTLDSIAATIQWASK